MSLVISIDYGHIYCKFIVIIRVFGSLDYYGKKKLDLGPMLHLFSSTSNLASFFSIYLFMVSSCDALPHCLLCPWWLLIFGSAPPPC